MTQNTKLIAHIFFAFLLGLVFVCTCYVGLPYDFSADLTTHATVLQNMSYSDLFRYTLNPLTPAWFFMTEIGYLRPIYYLIVKFFFDHFGATLLPVHVAVAVGAGLLCAFFFFAAVWITKRKWIAWLIVLFYLSLPTNAPMIVGYLSLDLQYIHSLISIAALSCFAALTFPASRKRLTMISLTMGWALLTWIAIKWKSSEKLLPFIYIVFLFLKFPALVKQLGIKKPLILLAISLSLFLLVIPIKTFESTLHDPQAITADSSLHIYTAKDQRMFRSDPKNIWYRTFFAPDQPNPMLKFRSSDMPYSLSGDLEPPLFVFFLSGMAGSFWLIKRRRKLQNRASADQGEHLFGITSLWLFVVLASFASGAPLEEVRYLNFALVPIMLLLAFLIRFCFDVFGTKPFSRHILAGSFLIFFTVPIIQNAAIALKWIGHFGGMQYVLHETERTMYEKLYGPLPSILELHYKHPEIERENTFVCWYSHSPDWKEQTLEKLRKKNRLFVLSRTNHDPYLEELRASGASFSAPAVFSFTDAHPMMFQVAKLAKKLGLTGKIEDRQILLYEATLKENSGSMDAKAAI